MQISIIELPSPVTEIICSMLARAYEREQKVASLQKMLFEAFRATKLHVCVDEGIRADNVRMRES